MLSFPVWRISWLQGNEIRPMNDFRETSLTLLQVQDSQVDSLEDSGEVLNIYYLVNTMPGQEAWYFLGDKNTVLVL